MITTGLILLGLAGIFGYVLGEWAINDIFGDGYL